MRLAIVMSSLRAHGRQSRISTAKPLCTTEDISEYALLNGEKIL
jgi:hypothetical protein